MRLRILNGHRLSPRTRVSVAGACAAAMLRAKTIKTIKTTA